MTLRLALLTALAAALDLPSLAGAAEESPFSAAIQAAMAAEGRPAEDIQRDPDRKPVETLAFFGIREDMRVLELFPGGGWYTRLLAPALRGRGKLYVALGTQGVREKLLGPVPFDRVGVLAGDVSGRPTGRPGVFSFPIFSFGDKEMDAVLTFRNLHNLTPESRAHLNAAVFEALRPGGVYGVVDHTRRHMQPDDPENRRRLDPVLVIKEVLAVGFDFEDASPLHYRPDDELRYEVGRRTVTGNTDRFTLRFRKPR
jgi:predicted methyltransferase